MRNLNISAKKPLNPFCKEHVIDWMRHPDPGSEFDRVMRFLGWLPNAILLFLFIHVLDYGGAVWVDDKGNVLGHVIYQRHGNDIHIFSVWVERSYRGQGIGTRMLRKMLWRAHADSSVERVRGGAGGSAEMVQLWERIVDELPFAHRESEEGWAWLSHR